jgi:hypothetical protein
MKATMLLALSTLVSAYVAEPVTLTCQGIVRHGIPSPATDLYPGKQGDPAPVSMNIVLNFTTRKIEVPGLSTIPIEIVQATDGLVVFNGYDKTQGFSWSLVGTIKVTGEMDADYSVVVNELNFTTTYSLKCKPAQRMF